jgi:hypothetical protein
LGGFGLVVINIYFKQVFENECTLPEIHQKSQQNGTFCSFIRLKKSTKSMKNFILCALLLGLLVVFLLGLESLLGVFY